MAPQETSHHSGSMKLPLLLMPAVLFSWNCRTSTHDGGAVKTVAERYGSEVSGLISRPVASPGFFSASLLAEGADIKLRKRDDASELQSSIGASEKMRCLVYRRRLMLPALFQAIANRLRRSFGKMQIVFLNTGIFKKNPYLESHVSYSTIKAGDPLHGVIKLIGVSFPDNSVLCLHDEPGFNTVFRHVVGRFVETLRFSNHSPAPFYREIHVYTVAGIRLGFRETAMFVREGTGRMNVTEESVVLPQAHGVVQTRHSSSRSLLDRAGWIERAEYRADENGKILYEILIIREGAESSYRISGNYRGRRIRKRFTVAGGLPGETMRRRKLLKWLRNSQREQELHTVVYLPALEPLRPLSLVMRRVTGDVAGGRTVVRYSAGQARIRAVIDERGREISSRIELPGSMVRSLRLFSRGTP